MREITITKKSSIQVGGCNACTDHSLKTGVVPHTVWEINLRNIGIRLCDECKKELSRKLK